jgi:hypothetical protein
VLAEWKRGSKSHAVRRAAHNSHAWDQASRVIAGVREQLAAVPADDVSTWSAAAREAAGIFAAWSARLEYDRPGPLAAAADALARSAQTGLGEPKPQRHGRVKDLRGVAMVVFTASARDEIARQVALVRQISRLMEAIHDMHLARGQERQAAALADVARTKLVRLHRPTPTSSIPISQGTPTVRPDGFGRGTDPGWER